MVNPFLAFSLVSSLLVVMTGLAVLAGWALGLDVVKSIIPGYATMKPNTAASFVLCAVSLLLFHGQSKIPRFSRFGGIVAAGLALITGLSALVEDGFGVDFGIDQFLFYDAASRRALGRMAPATATGFVVLASSLLWLRRRPVVSQCLATFTIILSSVALVGYLYGARALYTFFPYSSVALHSASCFFFLSAAVFSARPMDGIAAVLTSPGLGSLAARRLLPFAFGVPIFVGWLRLLGERLGLYTLEFGLALVVVTLSFLLSAIIIFNAAAINRADAERRANLDALLQAEKRQRTTLDQMMEGCQVIGFDWRYLYVNEAAARHGRAPRETLIGRRMQDAYPGIDTTPVFEFLKRCMENRASHQMENEFVYPDGTKAWFRLHVQPVPEGIFVLSIEITKEKQQALELERYHQGLEKLVKERTAQLESANRELEAFSYSVSHDLRAPLRHMHGFADLLRKRAGPVLDPESTRFLDIVTDSAERLGILIDELLVFSRMGRTSLKKVRFDVRRLVDDVLASFAGETEGRDVSWHITSLPEIEADPTMMRLVFQNLIENALKYTRQRTSTHVRVGSVAKEDTGEIEIFVKDNGVGFDPKYAHKLFNVFQRLHRADEFEGTGIGLASVRRIVERHGGHTWAESEPGNGATFFFSLPGGGVP